jgi:polyether ionophore transport system permease protein
MSAGNTLAKSTRKALAIPRSRVWFTNIFLKSLRDVRVGILGWGVGLGLLMLISYLAFPSTDTAKEELAALAKSFTWYSEPIAVTTVGGFATWRYGPFLLILLSVWVLLMGSRTLRGEEERGQMDALLSLPVARARVAVEKVAAIAMALLLACLIVTLFTLIGSARTNAGFTLIQTLLLGLNFALGAFFFAALALLIAQFTRERSAAAGVTGGLLALTCLIDGIGRVLNLGWLRWTSPFYYWGLSKPLIASYGTNAGALLVLTVGALILCGAAIWLFARRDIGAPALDLPRAPRLPAVSPVPDWTPRGVYARSLRQFGVIAFWSAVTLGLYMVLLISVTKQTENIVTDFYKSIGQSGVLQSLMGSGKGDAAFLNLEFSIIVLFPVVMAIMLVARWAAEEENGRLELVLATPRSRRQVILANFAAFTTALAVVLAVTFVVAWVSIIAAGLTVETGHLAQAIGGMLPLALVVGAVGYLLAGWLSSRWVIALLALLVVGSFFMTLLASSLNLPNWVTHLSIFDAYGSPLIDGLKWGAMVVVLGVTVVALVLAVYRFSQKDIAH